MEVLQAMKRRFWMGVLAVTVTCSMLLFAYFVRVDFTWRSQSAEAYSSPNAQTKIHIEQTRPVVNLQDETFILYSDLDGDGDLDIAYTTGSPIRFIENKTVERPKG